MAKLFHERSDHARIQEQDLIAASIRGDSRIRAEILVNDPDFPREWLDSRTGGDVQDGDQRETGSGAAGTEPLPAES